jgi:hypothetical protein
VAPGSRSFNQREKSVLGDFSTAREGGMLRKQRDSEGVNLLQMRSLCSVMKGVCGLGPIDRIRSFEVASSGNDGSLTSRRAPVDESRRSPSKPKLLAQAFIGAGGDSWRVSFLGTYAGFSPARSFVALLCCVFLCCTSSCVESLKPNTAQLPIISHETRLILHASVSFKYYDV